MRRTITIDRQRGLETCRTSALEEDEILVNLVGNRPFTTAVEAVKVYPLSCQGQKRATSSEAKWIAESCCCQKNASYASASESKGRICTETFNWRRSFLEQSCLFRRKSFSVVSRQLHKSL